MDKLIPKTTALAAVEVAFWNDDLAGAQKMIEEAVVETVMIDVPETAEEEANNG